MNERTKRIVIYIRHGPDKESDYKHDEKLTSEGKMMSRELAKELIKKYGLPDIIYYSPFYRTRQTRKEMVKAIKKYKYKNDIDKEVKLKIDTRLGRFFNRKERKRPDVHDSTIEKGAIVNEKWGHFKERVESHLNDVLNSDKYEVVWNITHTLVLLQVVNIQSISHSSHIPYLDTIIMKN